MTQTPAYHDLDMPEWQRDLQEYVASVTANAQSEITLETMYAALDRNGKDPALLDAATHLPMEQYLAFEERFKRHKVRHGMAGRKLRFS